MSKISLKHETEHELRFRHPHATGWIFVILGGTVAYFGLNHLDDRLGTWLMGGFGGTFALVGVGAAMWRHEITLDLASRTYCRLRGFWPSPRPLSGSLDELAGVVLSRKWRRSSSSNGGSNEHVLWIVSLEFRGWKKPVRICESQNERTAYQKLERYTKKLRTTAIDRTGQEEVRRSCDELDQSVAERAFSSDPMGSAPQTELPPDSAIVWTVDEGKSTITLPALGFSFGTVFLAFFGLAFASFGSLALLAVSGAFTVKTTGSAAGLWLLGGLFTIIGAAICLAAVVGSYARVVIREEGDAFTLSRMTFGRSLRTRVLPKSEIEEILLEPSASSRAADPEEQEILIRTDGSALRIGDTLQPDEQEWLRQTLIRSAGR